MEPGLEKSVATGIVAAILLTLSKYVPIEWVVSLMVVIGFILALASFLYASDWFVYHIGGRIVYYTERIADKMFDSKERHIIAEYSRLTPEQITVMRLLWPKQINTPGIAGAERMWNIDGVMVPDEFLIEFFERSDNRFLCPINKFSEGSDEREWAKAITDFMVSRRLANDHGGNRPARWVDIAGAARYFDFENIDSNWVGSQSSFGY